MRMRFTFFLILLNVFLGVLNLAGFAFAQDATALNLVAGLLCLAVAGFLYSLEP